MNKLLLFSITLLGFTWASTAQDISKNAIGFRLGDSNGVGAEISYQRALGDINRLEIDLGWRDSKYYDGFKLAGIYQWVWSLEGNFNWYAGVGGGLGSYDHYIKNYDYNKKETLLFAAGDIGIEYNFEIPIQISLDIRPELGFGDKAYDNNGLGFDVGLGARFQF